MDGRWLMDDAAEKDLVTICVDLDADQLRRLRSLLGPQVIEWGVSDSTLLMCAVDLAYARVNDREGR